jgi:vacuolar-type H+-ATPase subunit H
MRRTRQTELSEQESTTINKRSDKISDKNEKKFQKIHSDTNEEVVQQMAPKN